MLSSMEGGTHLSREHEVGVHGERGAVGDEVGDRLHDVPRVLPPREPRQHPELRAHQRQPEPRERAAATTRPGQQLVPLLFHKRENRTTHAKCHTGGSRQGRLDASQDK